MEAFEVGPAPDLARTNDYDYALRQYSDMLSNTRLYGAAIAVVSGGYSAWNATMGDEMTAGGWVMLVLGVVVIAHGIVLVTEVATRFGRVGGPLMIAYAGVIKTASAYLPL